MLTTTSINNFPILAIFAALALPLGFASPVAAQSYTLAGTIRDFTDSHAITVNGYTPHPDFEAYLGDDRNICNTDIGSDNKPVYNGTISHATITSASSFYQWYHDITNVNKTSTFSLTLNYNASTGLYTYYSNNFFPIDNQLLGNQGRNHNFGFTTEIDAQFTYQAGQSLTFKGDDDVFVFINRKLVIDLGGVHAEETATVNLNTLGLIPGNTYSINFFQAERHTTGSNYQIQTSAVLVSSAVPEVNELITASVFFGFLGILMAKSILRRGSQNALLSQGN